VILLGQRAVLDDLGLTAEQRARIEEMLARVGGFFPRPRRQFLEAARAQDAELRQILSPEQRRRLRQIGLQVQGTGAFREPEVSAALKLTAEQRERIQGIEEETFFGGLRMRPGTPPEEIRKHHEQRMREAGERILAVLTPEQTRRWREMTGEPFKGPVRFLPFGPPPGPPPR
jgi:hypothetical protein